MDILAAISLGTEPIVERTNVQEHEKETRISRQSKIFEKQMWRNIVVQCVYQVSVILCLMYFGIFIFVDSYNLVMAEVQTDKNKMQMNTMIFFTYFCMNMFNQINSRVTDENEINAFKTLHNNLIFWLVIAGEITLTHFMMLFGDTEFGSAILGVTKLTWIQYMTAWTLGALSLPMMIVAKKIPVKPFEKLMLKFDLEKENPDGGILNKIKRCLRLKKLSED